MAKQDFSGCGCLIALIAIGWGIKMFSKSQNAAMAALAFGLGLLVFTIAKSKRIPGKPPEAARTDKTKPTRSWHTAVKTHKPKPYTENLKVKTKPYALARFMVNPFDNERYYWDGRVGEDSAKLTRFNLPRLQTPEDIAKWLNIPLKTLAWLGDYHRNNAIEKVAKKQHYHYKFIKKRSGGDRLIEAPKPILKTIQNRILHEILDRVPAHSAAHGCIKGRSIQSNAAQHTGKYAVIKVDLENFYPKIRFKRVVTVFRGMGYCNEASHWLARLCTNRVPNDLSLLRIFRPNCYHERHLPQGAPTSPMLANLAAYPLDVRLSGLAKKFGVTYSRYVDDMTFSADEKFMRGKSCNWLIRYIKGIIRDEKFTWNGAKKKIIRRGHRQTVTGLTVNVKPNVSRKEFDRLKAILNNCARKGPADQNRDKRENFQAYLRGKISFVASVNPEKAARLQRIFDKIKWPAYP